jgi:YrbI family 3-deoxy-D-manno-octulosonate 8-phosphate phosphatase
MKKPSKKLIQKLAACRLLVMDFDGVLTDNKVYTASDGTELVRCDRSDSLGLEMLKKHTTIKILILSKEKNPVVRARARKLGIPALYHIDDKLPRLQKEAKKRHLKMSQICYVGNDTNDIECLQNSGLAIAVQNAEPKVKAVSDYLTEHAGGDGAVREICDLLIKYFNN